MNHRDTNDLHARLEVFERAAWWTLSGTFLGLVIGFGLGSAYRKAAGKAGSS